MKQLTAGTDTAYELAKKHGVKLAWGTDTLFDAKLAERQGAQLAKMVRWFTPAEVLKTATHDNACCSPSQDPGTLSPASSESSKKGRLPTCSCSTATLWRTSGSSKTPPRPFLVIMKDGKLIKNPKNQEPKRRQDLMSLTDPCVRWGQRKRGSHSRRSSETLEPRSRSVRGSGDLYAPRCHRSAGNSQFCHGDR